MSHDHQHHDGCAHVNVVYSISTAADFGDINGVRKALSSGTDPSRPDKYGYTALHGAARKGYDEIVDLLIKSGANVNADKCGCTPLHRAAYAGHIGTVKLLLRARAKVNVADKSIDLRTPLQKAASMDHVEVCKLLLESGADKTLKDKEDQLAADLTQNEDILKLLVGGSS